LAVFLSTVSNVNKIGNFERKVRKAWLGQPLAHLFNNHILGAQDPNPSGIILNFRACG
jgi:hypothetical protein